MKMNLRRLQEELCALQEWVKHATCAMVAAIVAPLAGGDPNTWPRGPT